MNVLHKKNQETSKRNQGVYRGEIHPNLGQKNEDFERAFK